MHLAFDPASGREMKGNHYCLVVSAQAFNSRFKLAWVCPIARGAALNARDGGFLISLIGYGLRTDGCVHTHQLKALDWMAGRATKVEILPVELMEQVLICIRAVPEDESFE